MEFYINDIFSIISLSLLSTAPLVYWILHKPLLFLYPKIKKIKLSTLQIFTLFVVVYLIITAFVDLDVSKAYYQILRWVTTICSGIFAYKYFNKKQLSFIIACSIAVLFNPIAPIYLEAETWKIIDGIVGGLLLLNVISSLKN